MDEYNPYSPEPQGSKALSIVSLCLGIATIVLCCCNPCNIPLGIGAIITGIIAKKKNLPGGGMALAGIICGSIGVALAIIVLIYNLATGNLQKSFEEGFNAGYNFGN
jgi:hypothetical protein